ncbi:MAG: DnaJ domain-containing protein [Desulfobulbaceae bacterium]|nr:DnaJ domain-containing protein [Desulfobulbaceae bacterium]MCK5404990.1 DnaJ domain-containing protein [Desulfobulbaceae bacterium]
MSAVVVEHELYRSCEILFGLGPDVNRNFLEYLQPSGIKTAYRKMARETHPDLAAAKGEAEAARHAVLFRAVHEAYKNLSRYIDAREKGYHFKRTPPRTASSVHRPRNTTGQKASHWNTRSNTTYRQHQARKNGSRHAGAYKKGPSASQRTATGHARQSFYAKRSTVGKNWAATQRLYNGPMPSRRLLFGHFLYYSGVTSWRTIIQAIVWQRTQRPRIGEIGNRFGWLTDKDIIRILRYRTFPKTFGESAIDLGLLTEMQLKTILFRQKQLQKKFGHYFTEANILSPKQLNTLIIRYHAHNAGQARSFKPGYRFS